MRVVWTPRWQWWLKTPPPHVKKKGKKREICCTEEFILASRLAERQLICLVRLYVVSRWGRRGRDKRKGERSGWKIHACDSNHADLHCFTSACTVRVYQQGCLTVYMCLSLSDIDMHVCACELACVLVFMSLFVFIFTGLTVTSGPQLECSWLQPVLNLYPALVTNTKLVAPLCFTFPDPPSLTSSLWVQLSASQIKQCYCGTLCCCGSSFETELKRWALSLELIFWFTSKCIVSRTPMFSQPNVSFKDQ